MNNNKCFLKIANAVIKNMESHNESLKQNVRSQQRSFQTEAPMTSLFINKDAHAFHFDFEPSDVGILSKLP